MSVAVSDVTLPFGEDVLALRVYTRTEERVCNSPAPVIVLCHGFVGVQGMLLPEMAQAFARDGFVAVTFDYRGFGDSGGERGRLTVANQQEDIRGGLRWVRNNPVLDERRIGLWGTGLGGGHALCVAYRNPLVRCVVSQMPVLDESTGRVSFSIKNTSSEPLLLATKVEDLDGKGFSKSVLVSPPISRIEAGQSQQVNFVLRQGAVLPHEVMLKASFEGIGQAVDNSTRMPIRQSIGMIIQPKSVAVSKTPWEDLQVTREGDSLTVKNTGLHVIRLAPQLVLLPANQPVPLENYYLMAGESKIVNANGQVTSVRISPLSRYGFRQDDVTVAVKS